VFNLRPYQIEAKEAILRLLATNHSTLVEMATGLGKAQPLNALLLGPSGWKPMGFVQVGDSVIGSDGLPHCVTGVFPQGRKQVFRVCFSDGSSTRCCAEHLWNVQTKSQKCRNAGYTTVPLEALFGDLIDGSGASKWFVPVVSPIEFDSKQTPIDPYALGVLIGDGGLKYRIMFSSADPFIVDQMTKRIPGITVKFLGGFDYAIRSGDRGKYGCKGAPIPMSLRELGLFGHGSESKFIPDIYLFNDVETRLAVLRGLMDTDGHVRSDGHTEFSTVSLRLAQDVCELVRSLGGCTRVRSKAPGKYTYNGEKRIGRPSFRVTVTLNGINPFLLPRKANAAKLKKNQGQTKAITDIKRCVSEECQCIKVDSPDQLYVTDDYILTHNTILFGHIADEWPGRVLVIAHRDELIRQAAEKITSITGRSVAIEMGREKAEDSLYGCKVTVASIQTLARSRRRQRFHPDHFSLLVIDEGHHCFPAGTVVDNMPIEDIKPGMVTTCVDMMTGQVVQSTVRQVYSRPALGLVKVTFANGDSLFCTHNHHVMTQRGWVCASELQDYDAVYKLPNVQRSFPCHKSARSDSLPSLLLKGLQNEVAGSLPQICADDLLGLREVGCSQGQKSSRSGHERKSILLRRMQEHRLPQSKFSNSESHQSSVCVGADESTEPCSYARNQSQNLSIVEGQNISRERRKWNADSAAAAIGGCSRMENGTRYRHQESQRTISVLAEELQGGHRQPISQDRHRDRWENTSLEKMEVSGQEENSRLELVRVDSVEVLERGSDGRFGGLCPDGNVYDLEIEHHHNYFADGYLVHNSVAITYRETLDYFQSAKRLLVTATPKRADQIALECVCETVAYQYGIEQAIDDGWLVPVRQAVVKVEGLDFSKARTVADDFNQADLERILTEEKPLHAMCASAIEMVGDRQAIWFCASVAHARSAAGVLARYPNGGVAFLSGETPKEERREAVDRYKRGETQHLLNCGLFLEGFDAPSTSAIVMGRPTKSLSLYMQILGRGTRPLAGVVDGVDSPECRREAISLSPKPHMMVVDYAGNAGKHKIIQAADVLGGKHSPEVRAYAKQTMEEEGRTVDLEESLKRAADEQRLLSDEEDRRRNVTAAVDYKTYEISPFVRQYNGTQQQKTQGTEDKCSIKQAGYICHLAREVGVEGWTFEKASNLSRRQAKGIIGKLQRDKR